MTKVMPTAIIVLIETVQTTDVENVSRLIETARQHREDDEGERHTGDDTGASNPFELSPLSSGRLLAGSFLASPGDFIYLCFIHTVLISSLAYFIEQI